MNLVKFLFLAVCVLSMQSVFASEVDLSLEFLSPIPSEVKVMEQIRYEVAVRNNGDVEAHNVFIYIDYGDGPIDTRKVLQVGNLLPGDNKTFSLTSMFWTPGEKEFMAFVKELIAEPILDTLEATTLVLNSEADAYFTGEAQPKTATVGLPFTHRLELGNSGPDFLYTAQLHFTLPPSVNFLGSFSRYDECFETSEYGDFACNVGFLSKNSGAPLELYFETDEEDSVEISYQLESEAADDNMVNNYVTISHDVIPPAACREYSGNIFEHLDAGRVNVQETTTWYWKTQSYYVKGSNEPLGTNPWVLATLYSRDGEYFQLDSCPEEDAPPEIIKVEPHAKDSYAEFTISVDDINSDASGVMMKWAWNGLSEVIDCVQASGQWLCTTPELEPSFWTREVYFVAFDQKGYRSPVFGSVEYHVGGENLPVIDSTALVVNGTSVSIIGEASDDDFDLKRVYIVVDGSEEYDCSGLKSFTCELSDLDLGRYTVDVFAEDYMGHTSLAASNTRIDFEISEPIVNCITDFNTNHIASDRAYVCGFPFYAAACVTGGGQFMGFANNYVDDQSSMLQTVDGSWVLVEACSE